MNNQIDGQGNELCYIMNFIRQDTDGCVKQEPILLVFNHFDLFTTALCKMKM